MNDQVKVLFMILLLKAAFPKNCMQKMFQYYLASLIKAVVTYLTQEERVLPSDKTNHFYLKMNEKKIFFFQYSFK